MDNACIKHMYSKHVGDCMIEVVSEKYCHMVVLLLVRTDDRKKVAIARGYREPVTSFLVF